VSALPKGALVEKQALYHSGQCLVRDDDDEILRSITPSFSQGRINGIDGAGIYWTTSTFEETAATLTILAFRETDDDMKLKLKSVSELNCVWKYSLSIRLFYRPHRAHTFLQHYDCLFEADDPPSVTSIPCRSISTCDADDWDFAMYIIGS